jgi:hypothetical protein
VDLQLHRKEPISYEIPHRTSYFDIDFRTTCAMENEHEIWNLEYEATVRMWAFVKTLMNLQIIS